MLTSSHLVRASLFTLLFTLTCSFIPFSLLAQTPSSLPLSSVVLYSSGVGYFQHDGTVQDREQTILSVPQSHMNDLLKSLVVQDFDGGNISSMQYGSQDPLGKTLGRFAINLSRHPDLSQILSQIRGEPVEISTSTLITGIIVGIEKKTEHVGSSPTPKVITVEYVTLLTQKGLQRIPLAQIQHLRLLNSSLDREFRQALSTLAAHHDNQKRTVTLTFEGKGSRRVRMAYLHEMPVWKTAYRLVLNSKQSPYLQGWAIVENTSEQDWSNVNLSLIAGRPISFIMDLYQPLYLQRPLVTPDLHSTLRPQTYEERIEEPQMSREMAEEAMVKGYKGKRPASPAAKKSRRMELDRDDLASQAAPTPFNLQQGVQAQAQGDEVGELFSYQISTPVTVLRHSSAMLPILNEDIDGEKVSIYNQTVHAKHPLHGFRLKNTSALHLMQGPMTVFEDNSYAGDAHIHDLAPNETRLISYALDVRTEVVPKSQTRPQQLLTASIKKGTLHIKKQFSQEYSYLIRNREDHAKSLLIEHPNRSNWTLEEPKGPIEQTRTLYRFPLTIEANQTTKLSIREVKPFRETIQLLDSRLDRIELFVSAPHLSPQVKQALVEIVKRRVQIGQVSKAKTNLERRTRELTKEQDRIRKNMQRLAHTSPLYKRYVKKLDKQESKFEELQREIDTLKKKEELKQKDLETYLLNLDIT